MGMSAATTAISAWGHEARPATSPASGPLPEVLVGHLRVSEPPEASGPTGRHDDRLRHLREPGRHPNDQRPAVKVEHGLLRAHPGAPATAEDQAAEGLRRALLNHRRAAKVIP